MSQIIVRLTDQQLELVGASIGAAEAPDAPSLVRLALRETAEGLVARVHPRTHGTPWRWWDGIDAADERTVLQETVLEAGTGKAFEVRAGQVLRVEQVTGD